jgi:hypothetical protein
MVHGIEAVILKRDVDVIHVQQYAAVGCMDDFIEELPPRHLRFMKFSVTADIFDDWNLKEIQNLTNACSRHPNRFECVVKGQ